MGRCKPGMSENDNVSDVFTAPTMTVVVMRNGYFERCERYV